jgi:hypothetical protein
MAAVGDTATEVATEDMAVVVEEDMATEVVTEATVAEEIETVAAEVTEVQETEVLHTKDLSLHTARQTGRPTGFFEFY